MKWERNTISATNRSQDFTDHSNQEDYRRELSPVATLWRQNNYISPVKGVYNRKGSALVMEAQGATSLSAVASNQWKRQETSEVLGRQLDLYLGFHF